MTRCKNCSYNYQLKSSVYNQTGQCYEVQLAAYGAMTNHLRRVLLAKSVVDSGKVANRISRQSESTTRRAKTVPRTKKEINSVGRSSSQDLSNRFAYDTKHHPHDIAIINSRGRRRCRCCCAKYNANRKDTRSNSTDSEDSGYRDYPGSMEKIYGREKHKTKFGRKPLDNSGEENVDEHVKKCGKLDALKSFGGMIPRVSSTLEIFRPRTTQFISSLGETTQSSDSMYVKFLYDITKEVMKRGCYSDREMEMVFEEHFERNLGRLSENKMLREINSLKKALSMNHDSEEEEEEKEGVKISENRVLLAEKISSEIAAKKRVSDEIIVSKEDVMNTLLEMNLNPEKAEEICESLQNRSKEASTRRVKNIRKNLSVENLDEESTDIIKPEMMMFDKNLNERDKVDAFSDIQSEIKSDDEILKIAEENKNDMRLGGDLLNIPENREIRGPSCLINPKLLDGGNLDGDVADVEGSGNSLDSEK